MKRLILFAFSAALISFGCASAPEQETQQLADSISDLSARINSSDNQQDISLSLGVGEGYVKLFQNCGVWDKDCIAEFFEKYSNLIENYIGLGALNHQENDSTIGIPFSEWCRCEKNTWKWQVYSDYMFFRMSVKKALKYRMESADYTCAMNALRNYCDEYPAGEAVKIAEACIRQLDGDLWRNEKRGQIILPIIMSSDSSAQDKGPLVTILVKSVPLPPENGTGVSYDYCFVVDNQTLDFAGLEKRIARLNTLAGRSGPKEASTLRVYIYADREAPARAIQDILAVCKTRCINKIAFVTAYSDQKFERTEGLLKTYAPHPWPEDIPQVDLSQCYVDIYWTLRGTTKPPRIRHDCETLATYSKIFKDGHFVVRCIGEKILYLDFEKQTEPDYKALTETLKSRMVEYNYLKTHESDKPFTLVIEPWELVPIGEVLKVVEAGKKAGITNFRFWAPLVDDAPLGENEKPVLDEPTAPDEGTAPEKTPPNPPKDRQNDEK